MSGIYEMKLEPEESSVSAASEDTLSSVSYKYLSGENESKSRVKRKVEECTDMNYYPGGEGSVHFSGIDSSGQFDKGHLNTHIIKQEYHSEGSDSSSSESSSESHNYEEFADLLQQCYPKSTENDVTIQPANGDEETLRERSAESNCVMADVKEEDESDSETSDASSFVAQLMDSERTELGVINTRQQSAVTVQRNKCPLCMRDFSNFRGLKRHIQRIHHEERQHQCTQCDKSYSVKSDLDHHTKHVHGEKMYKCDKCEFSSKYSQNLKTHIAAVHLEEKLYKCPQCDTCYTHQSGLTKHISSIHNQEKPYECPSCDRKFSQRQHCDRHFRTVHCGEKPYSCDQCDYRCSEKHTLTQHQRSVHDGVKRYPCANCEYKGATKTHLKRHCLAVHCQHKPYSCGECGKAFSQAEHLNTHTDAVHRGLKSQSCSECGKSFSDKYKLKKHMTAVHKQVDQSKLS